MKDWGKFATNLLLACILGLGGIVWRGQEKALVFIRDHEAKTGHREMLAWKEYVERRLAVVETTQKELVSLIRDIRDALKEINARNP